MMDALHDWSPETIIRHHPPWGRVGAQRGTRGVGWGKTEAKKGKVHTCWVGTAVTDATMANTPHRRGDMACIFFCRKIRLVLIVITSECARSATLGAHNIDVRTGIANPVGCVTPCRSHARIRPRHLCQGSQVPHNTVRVGTPTESR
jgi:hypothetical protein